MNASVFCAPESPGAASVQAETDTPNQEPQRDEGVVLPSGGRVNVDYKQTPSAPVEDKKIHSRRPLPIVPERSTDDK